jgi:hypothetical protein
VKHSILELDHEMKRFADDMKVQLHLLEEQITDHHKTVAEIINGQPRPDPMAGSNQKAVKA